MNPFYAESKRCLTTFQSPSIRKTLQQNLNVIILEEIFLNFGWFSYHIIGKTKLDDLPFVGTYSSWLINGWILSFSQHNPSDLTIGTMAAWGGRQWVRPMWHGPAEAGDPGFFWGIWLEILSEIPEKSSSKWRFGWKMVGKIMELNEGIFRHVWLPEGHLKP